MRISKYEIRNNNNWRRMVGLSIAYQLIERNISKNIVLIEKESNIGMHTR